MTNRVFNDSEFMSDLLKNQKNVSFGGDVISYQNRAPEHSIKTVVTIIRTMLMHAMLICPEDTLITYLLPMSMDYAVCIYNRPPNNSF